MAERRRSRGRVSSAPKRRRFWSAEVMRRSDAMDLEPGVFGKRSPRAIALSLRRSAERSTRRKSGAYRSAMSMLSFYVNRAGSRLSEAKRRRLERAKQELRKLYGRFPAPAKGKQRSTKHRPAVPSLPPGDDRDAAARARRT